MRTRRHVYTYDAAGFHRAAVQSVAVMRECLAQHSALVCATNPRVFRTKTQLHIGMYACFLELWLAFFPREQFLVLRQEDLAAHSAAMMARVTQHLALPPLPPHALQATANRPNALARAAYKQGMLPETRALLAEFYAPFNAQLAALVGDPAFNYHGAAADPAD